MADLQTFERSAYQQVKADLHRKILDRMDLEKLGKTSSETAREEVLALIRNLVSAEAVPLSFAERERLSREILDEIFGLGPLEPLLERSYRLRHPREPFRPGIHRAGRQAGIDQLLLQRQSAPDADHRSHCVAGGPARG